MSVLSQASLTSTGWRRDLVPPPFSEAFKEPFLFGNTVFVAPSTISSYNHCIYEHSKGRIFKTICSFLDGCSDFVSCGRPTGLSPAKKI